MFDRIARRYDLLNTVMSGGRHHAWRRMAVDMAVRDMIGPALDVAAGTGDFTLELARREQITRAVGLDFAREMLLLGKRKAQRKGLSGSVTYAVGDAHSLPFPDNHFICATVGFGVRNFVDVPLALRELARVVRPGGRVAVLEIVRMEGGGPIAKLFPVYFRYVTPRLGALLAGDREAYTYLPESVQGFLSGAELGGMMQDAGLANVTARKLALGSVAVVVGEAR